MKRIAIYCLMIPMLVCGCHKMQRGYADSSSFDQDVLQKLPGETLKGEVALSENDVLHPTRVFCIDSFLFLVNRNSTKLLDVYDIGTLNKLGSCIDCGNGPDELIIVNQIQQDNGSVWLLDQMKKKFYRYSLPSFRCPEEVRPEQVVELGEGISNAVILSSGNIFATGFDQEDRRFLLFNSDGECVEKKTNYPGFGSRELTGYERMESFRCQLVMSEELQTILVANMQTDLIELYDLTGNLKKRVHGPDQFFPSVKEVRDNDMIHVIPQRGETHDAYFSPQEYNNEFWVIYSGQLFDDNVPQQYLNNTVIVFDADGNPKRHYQLDTPVFTFAIDKINRKIYGITDSPDMQVIRFDIP